MGNVFLFLFYIIVTIAHADTLCDHILSGSLRFKNFNAVVSKIYDGDTIKVDVGNNELYKIRLIGMDAPESYYKGESQGEIGEISKQYFSTLLNIGDEVMIQTEIEALDQYGRILGYVYKDDRDIGYQMLKAGMAIPYLINPNISKAEEYSQVSDFAVSNKIGLFKQGFTEPYLWRRQVNGLTITKYVKDIRDGKIYKPSQYFMVPMQFRIFLNEKPNP